MPDLDYVLPCRLTSIDARTNSISVFGLIDQIDLVDPHSVPGAGLPYLALQIVVGWRKGAGDSDEPLVQRVTVVSPTGDEDEIDVMTFRMGSPRQRVLTSVPRLVLANEGRYLIRVYIADASDLNIDWGEPRGEYSIDVVFAERLIRVPLTKADREILSKDVRGQGGYQSLLRRLQNSIYDSELVLTTEDAERLIRSAASYGEGGFQRRLRAIMEKVRQALARVVDAELIESDSQ